jgi:hypothetical protein
MISVAPLGSVHRKVTDRLEALASVVRAGPRLRRLAFLTGDTEEKAHTRWRKQIRKRAYAVLKDLQKMRSQAETPAWLRRVYNRAWGEFDSVFDDIDPDTQQQLRLLASGVVREASLKPMGPAHQDPG